MFIINIFSSGIKTVFKAPFTDCFIEAESLTGFKYSTADEFKAPADIIVPVVVGMPVNRCFH